jgi:hypothetical protein
LYEQYELPLDLYLRLKQSIKNNTKEEDTSVTELVSVLPGNLSIELSLFIHESTYSKVEFLMNNRSESFLAWICPKLVAQRYDE